MSRVVVIEKNKDGKIEAIDMKVIGKVARKTNIRMDQSDPILRKFERRNQL